MDPQVDALLKSMAEAAAARNAPPLWEQDLVQARKGVELGYAGFNAGGPELGSVVERTFSGPAGEVPVMILTPQGSGPFPVMVYFHGGGWTIMNPRTHRRLTGEFAAGGGCVVVSVDYRLAPEHPAPAPLDDCMAAIGWALANAGELNADPSRFALGGDSAGANLAAAAALRLRDERGPKARLMLLLYGVFQDNPDTASMIRNREGKILTRDAMQWFWRNYLAGGASDRDPYVAPLHGDLAGMPAAHIIAATLDPLFDDSVALAEKMRWQGVPVALSVYEDMPHFFMHFQDVIDAGKRAITECCAALRSAFM